MGRHSSASSAAAVLALAVLFLVAFAAVASASMVQVDRFGGPGNGAGNGQLSGPSSVAVNQGSGDAYVVEVNNRRVSQFDSTGRFVRMWGHDVDADDPGTGFEICESDGNCKTGAVGAAAGQFNQANGIAVNQASGHVYVADLGNRRVQEFDAAGNFVRAWGWNVDATNPETEFEICPAGNTCQAGSTGAGSGQFGATATGRIAVDPVSGDVYVADPGNRRVQKFDAAGNFLATIGAAGTGDGQFAANQPLYVAVDGNGNLYASDGNASGRIQKFASNGAFAAQIAAPPLSSTATSGLAANPANGHLFASRSNGSEIVVQEFDAAGLPVDTHAVGERISAVSSIAFGASPERLLVTASSGTATGTVSVLAAVAPDAVTTGAAPLTATSARLNGYVDPNGWASTYRFEYGTDSGYGSSLPVGAGAEAGGAAAAVLVSQELNGLQPGTTYHYRLVVEYAGGTVAGPDRAFTTRTVAEMSPPPRGLELVSNPNKGNQNVGATEGKAISPSGEQAYWLVAGGAPGAATGAYNLFLSTRFPNGWGSTSVVPPAVEQFGEGSYHYRLLGVSDSGRQFLFFVDQGILGATPYAIARVDLDRGSTVLRAFPTNNVQLEMEKVNGNRGDYSRVVYPDPADGQLYDYGSGVPKLVSVMPNGSAPSCGIAEHGWHLNENDWISADGSRLFFISAGDDCAAKPQLYLRNLVTETTVSVAGEPDHGPLRDTVFIRANADASRAVFVSNTALVAADQNVNWDIYEYRQGAPLSCLTCEIVDAQVAVSGVTQAEQPVLASDDLSRVYFVSRKQLRPGARSASPNLYLWKDGQVRFVAPANVSYGSWNMSADGERLLFESEDGTLTADQTGNTQQLYLYDDGNRSLECVSCKRNGPTTVLAGDSYFFRTWKQMSADGSTVAFATAGQLVPEDINGTGDVYEWRDGVVRLVTDGETKFPVGFADALPRDIDATGRNILFSAAGRLTGFEQESTANLYVARIGGGFTPSTPPQPCVEDSCQGPLEPVPGMPAPGSAGVDGGGNVRESTAARRPGKKRASQRKKRRAAKKRAHARKKQKQAQAKRGVTRNG